jgi:tetraacyldisaccharide 4'-kinase
VQAVLLDDGFQNKRIKKDLELLLIDAHKGLGNNRVLPAGPLREPLETMRRADVVLFTKKGDIAGDSELLKAVAGTLPNIPTFTLSITLSGFRHAEGTVLSIEEMQGKEAIAFCGIGNPGGFFRMLEENGIIPLRKRLFPDHHRYTQAELIELATLQRQLGKQVALITTAKDAINLPPPPYPTNMFTAEISVDIPAELLNFVENALTAYGS